MWERELLRGVGELRGEMAQWLGVYNTAPEEDQSSVPITQIGMLITACNSNPREI